MRQKAEIEIEISETVAYSRRRERFENFCPTCKTVSEMVTPQLGYVLSRTTEREIYRLVETGRIHFVETDRVLMCLKSLTETLSESPAVSVERFLRPVKSENLNELFQEIK